MSSLKDYRVGINDHDFVSCFVSSYVLHLLVLLMYAVFVYTFDSFYLLRDAGYVDWRFGQFAQLEVHTSQASGQASRTLVPLNVFAQMFFPL
jgi:hypothetical protein